MLDEEHGMALVCCGGEVLVEGSLKGMSSFLYNI